MLLYFEARFPSGLSVPLNASVTIWEATAPVKLPTRHCPRTGRKLEKSLVITLNLSSKIFGYYYLKYKAEKLKKCFQSSNSPGLAFKLTESGITLLPPRPPERTDQRLPPILGTINSNAMPSYSKAPRGLFVLLQVDGIFTVIAISPSSSLRQLPSRYAFHAGRNLPDKEFRYLRTIHLMCLPPTLCRSPMSPWSSDYIIQVLF